MKKGLSTIVTTVIMVALSLAAILIVWVVIQNTIGEEAESIAAGSSRIALKIENVLIGENEITIKVNREVGRGNLSKIKFVLTDIEDETKTYEKDTSLTELGSQKFQISLEGLNNISKISIAPIIESESGKDYVLGITDTKNFQEVLIEIPEEECTPECPAASTVNCGEPIIPTNGCGSCFGWGSYCQTGSCHTTSHTCVEECTPECPAASTVNCGEPIIPTNGCGSCEGVGTKNCCDITCANELCRNEQCTDTCGNTVNGKLNCNIGYKDSFDNPTSKCGYNFFNQASGTNPSGNCEVSILSLNDPYFYKTATFDESYNRLKVKYKSYSGGPATFKLYYNDKKSSLGSGDCYVYDEKCSQFFYIISDGQWHILDTQITDAEWVDNDGIIDDIRFDFDGANSLNIVYIDYIKFYKNI